MSYLRNLTPPPSYDMDNIPPPPPYEIEEEEEQESKNEQRRDEQEEIVENRPNITTAPIPARELAILKRFAQDLQKGRRSQLAEVKPLIIVDENKEEQGEFDPGKCMTQGFRNVALRENEMVYDQYGEYCSQNLDAWLEKFYSHLINGLDVKAIEHFDSTDEHISFESAVRSMTITLTAFPKRSEPNYSVLSKLISNTNQWILEATPAFSNIVRYTHKRMNLEKGRIEMEEYRFINDDEKEVEEMFQSILDWLDEQYLLGLRVRLDYLIDFDLPNVIETTTEEEEDEGEELTERPDYIEITDVKSTEGSIFNPIMWETEITGNYRAVAEVSIVTTAL